MTPLVIATIDKGEPVEVRLTLRPGRGRTLCEIRQFEKLKTPNLYMATREGLSIEVGRIGELIKALQTARAGAGLDG